MYYVSPLADHIANFIFGVAAVFFALMAVTDAAYKKSRHLLLAVFLMGLSLFLTSSFDVDVRNPHLSDMLRTQAFRKELLHQGLLCVVAAIIYYGLRIRPEQTIHARSNDQTA